MCILRRIRDLSVDCDRNGQDESDWFWSELWEFEFDVADLHESIVGGSSFEVFFVSKGHKRKGLRLWSYEMSQIKMLVVNGVTLNELTHHFAFDLVRLNWI